MAELRFERLTDAAHPLYEKAIELYRISFPYHEQREAPSRKRILTDDAYHFNLIYDEKTFVGLLLYWETEDFLYIEHFCRSCAASDTDRRHCRSLSTAASLSSSRSIRRRTIFPDAERAFTSAAALSRIRIHTYSLRITAAMTAHRLLS